MKKILFPILVLISTFLIYSLNIDKKKYVLSLGDYLSYGINSNGNIENNYNDKINEYYNKKVKKYINYSTYDDYRVRDLINDINYNREISYNNKIYNIQNLLVKSNLIVISIGMNDLIYKKKITNTLTYEYIDGVLDDIEELFKIIRKYNKDRILFLSFYNVINNIEIIRYSNEKLEYLCKKYKITYVDISSLEIYIPKSNYPTNEGYNYISNKIITLLNKKNSI